MLGNLHSRETVLSTRSRHALESLPEDLVDSYSIQEMDLVVDAFQTLDVITAGEQAPKPFQVQTAVALRMGKNVMATAPTGAGKTLAMELSIMLLEPHKLVLTLVPLKLLQRNHFAAFDKHGIKSLVVNEDTQYGPEVWKALSQGVSPIRNIFCAPEQFHPLHGHIPRLATLLKVPAFVNSVGILLIDEGHFIVTDGQPHGDEAAHRPAYGKLGDLRNQLPAKTPCAVFSGTLPPSVKAFIRADLGMDNFNTVDITLPTNRPNIMQAVIPLIGNLGNLENLNFLAPIPYHPPMAPISRGVVFIDHKLSTAAIADHLNARLPPGIRETRPFRHLHSSMSRDYITEVYETFKQPDSPIRMIITTAAASHGLDVPDLEVVIMYGIPKTMIEFLQRMGRVGRTPTINAICLTIAEDWACKLAVEEEDVMRKVGVKEKRTELAMIRYASCPKCLRKFVMDYSGEEDWDDGFRLQDYFQGPILTAPRPKVQVWKPRAKYWPVAEREELMKRLITWARITHLDDPVHSQWPRDWILPDTSAKLLAREVAGSVDSPSKISALLEENKDWEDNWAALFLSVVTQYDAELAAIKAEKAAVKAAIKADKAAARVAARQRRQVKIPTVDEDDELGPESEDLPSELEDAIEFEDEEGLDSELDDDELGVQDNVGDESELVASLESHSEPAPVDGDVDMVDDTLVAAQELCVVAASSHALSSVSRSLRRRRRQANSENGVAAPDKSPPEKRRRLFAMDTTNTYSKK
ncbi:hypothetical protein HWV62_6719 [Athelia sp. TMB]|nr:hypothetical protein HWV62_6719 [Athelia sp. TMB]